jgi:MATE family multidrug resistance protein
LASIYILADSTQLVFAGALRGAGDTAWVMWISVALHWVLAVSAYLLTRVLVLPPVSVWIFFICFVLTLGVSMYLRYRTGAWKLIQVIEAE